MASYCCTLATASYCCTYCCTRTNEGRSHDRNRPLSWVEPRGFEPLTSWLQISARPVYGGRWSRSAICGSPARPLAGDGVAVFGCCTASRPAAEAVWLEPSDPVREVPVQAGPGPTGAGRMLDLQIRVSSPGQREVVRP
jgi:hypothetical protein